MNILKGLLLIVFITPFASNNQTPTSVESFTNSSTSSKEPILNFFIER